MVDTPAKDRPTERFLDAEQAAAQLVIALEGLKEEAEGYANAEQSLRESGERLVRLAERIEELATRSAEALEVVRSVGGPQIVKELRAILPMLENQALKLSGHDQALDDLAAKTTELQETAASNGAELAAIRSDQAQYAGAIETTIKAAQSRMQLLAGGVAFLTLVVLILAVVLLVR